MVTKAKKPKIKKNNNNSIQTRGNTPRPKWAHEKESIWLKAK